MKKTVVLWLLAFVVCVYFGAGGPVDAQQRGDGIRDYHQVADTATVDSAIGGNWDPIDSLVVTRDDSGIIRITFQAQAEFNPLFGGLYVGMGNDSANRVSAATAATTGQTNTNFDTAYFQCPKDQKVSAPIVVTYTWFDTASTASAKTDTYYFNCATAATYTKVALTKIRIWGDPIQKDSI